MKEKCHFRIWAILWHEFLSFIYLYFLWYQFDLIFILFSTFKWNPKTKKKKNYFKTCRINKYIHLLSMWPHISFLSFPFHRPWKKENDRNQIPTDQTRPQPHLIKLAWMRLSFLQNPPNLATLIKKMTPPSAPLNPVNQNSNQTLADAG